MYIQNYSEIKKVKPISARGIIRKATLDLISMPILLDEKYFSKPRIQFLYVHHVFKDEETGLIKLIEFLRRDHQFLSYSVAVDKLLTGDIDKPYIVFSSDDGLKNNITAADILSRYGISACFFVNPFTIEQHDYEIVKKFCSQRIHFPPVEFMNWQDLEKLLTMGHEIGSHTINHVNIAECTDEIIKEEIEKSFTILNNKIGNIKHFAYPYGRHFHFNEYGRKIVFCSGYQSCASAERGCHISNGTIIKKEQVLLRRDHVLLNWNLNHIKYFLLKNSKNSSHSSNFFTQP